jgi:outer membrane protein assembly factor BamB
MSRCLFVFAWVSLVLLTGPVPGRAEPLLQRNAAARLGLTRAWYAQVGAPRSSGTIAHIRYDAGSLLVQTTRGMLIALDGETGRSLWTTQAGPSDHQCTEPDANDKFVVMVNGSFLYVLDRANGHILWDRQLGGAPGAGPAVSATHAFVPMLNGRIEGYDLEQGPRQQPWIYKSAGRMMVPPLATAQSVCWTTGRGYFYVADPSGDGIRYRLETRDAIESRPAFWTPKVYAGSTDGYVYSLDEASGKMNWKFPIGDAIIRSPVAIDDKVFVVSEVNGLYCLDGQHGDPLWFAPRISQFVSMSPTRVYACDHIGRLVALDARTGTRLGTMTLDGISFKLSNGQSDRIFLASGSNVVQCLRETDLKNPTLHVPPPPKGQEKPATPDRKEPSKSSTDEPSDEPAAMDADTAPEEPAVSDETPPATDDDADNPFK